MKIAVLGSTGMLGHKMVERLRLHYSDVVGLSRDNGLDARDLIRTENMFRLIRPQIIINCVGTIKQRTSNAEEVIAVNALFPHFLQRICTEMGVRLIHFSTDCVFSGKRGLYTESDIPDPIDHYGYTKAMGEILFQNALTIRTSIVGRERGNYHGLLEWFLRQQGEIQGYENAIWTGVTTNWLADTVAELLKYKKLQGLYNIASFPVSKFRLLELFQRVYNRTDIRINPTDNGNTCDRSLKGNTFRAATGIRTPDIADLLVTQREQDKESGYAV
jgi:dTDP-4-dehydrorhamnose reductase